MLWLLEKLGFGRRIWIRICEDEFETTFLFNGNLEHRFDPFRKFKKCEVIGFAYRYPFSKIGRFQLVEDGSVHGSYIKNWKYR